MTVFLWPDEGERLCVLPNGLPAAGRKAILYTDAGATTPAAIRVYDGSGTPGALIANSQVTLDIYGQQPSYWGPDFPTGTQPQLYIVVNGTGPATAIGPQVNPRLTALEAGGGGGGGGTPSSTVITEQTYGQGSSAGTATAYSRGDHTHGTPATPAVPTAAGTVVTETSYGQGSSAGAAGTFSRGDHTHGTPATPAVPAAATTVQAGTSYAVAGAVGTASTYAREDHQHGTVSLTAAAPTASAVGDTAAVGTAVLPARADHLHGREGFGNVTAQTAYGAGSANGSATTEARADHQHGTVSLTAVVPTTSAVADAAAVGVGTAPAREDHKHGREAFGAVATATTYGTASTSGAAATLARSDHNHGSPALSAVAPTSSAVGDAAAVGTGTVSARSDHVHGREAFGTVVAQTTYGAASTSGSATTEARSDHAHGTVSLPTAAQVGAPALATVTAKGDLYVATASGTVTNVPVGSNTFVLTADSTQTAGVKWAAPGGTGAYSLPDGIDPPSGAPHAVPNGPVGPNLTTVLNRGYMVPVPMGATTRTLNEISLEVAVAGAAGCVFRLVLWSATGRVPNVSFADLGTVAGDTTGVKALAGLTNSFVAGTLYWVQVIEQVATGAALRAVASYNPYVTLQGGTLAGSVGFSAYVMNSLSGAVTNGTTFTYFDVDEAPRLGLKFA